MVWSCAEGMVQLEAKRSVSWLDKEDVLSVFMQMEPEPKCYEDDERGL